MTIFSGDNAMVLKNIQTSPFACLKIFDFYCNTETTFEKTQKNLEVSRKSLLTLSGSFKLIADTGTNRSTLYHRTL